MDAILAWFLLRPAPEAPPTCLQTPSRARATRTSSEWELMWGSLSYLSPRLSPCGTALVVYGGCTLF